ncbi:MAG TPA: hypothetical protein VM166_01360 [Gemmatimonadaceae bacterium]|nr:hypothetical protein [Gemmatimonadaceae bacterium]
MKAARDDSTQPAKSMIGYLLRSASVLSLLALAASCRAERSAPSTGDTSATRVVTPAAESLPNASAMQVPKPSWRFAIERDSSAAVIALSDSSAGCCVLHLPSAVYAALEKGAPDLRLWQPPEYVPESLIGYEPSARQAPFAVIGDFDGDGRLDVVIDGRTERDALRIALLQAAPGGQISFLEVWREAIDPSASSPQALRVLRHVPPGEVSGPDADPLRLRHDAFEVVNGDSATLFYFYHGQFVPFATAD